MTRPFRDESDLRAYLARAKNDWVEPDVLDLDGDEVPDEGPESVLAGKEEVIVAIDPGPVKSAYVVITWQGGIVDKNILANDNLLDYLSNLSREKHVLAIEMVSSYGMPVGKDVFETVWWIGRFCQRWGQNHARVYRHQVKMHFCKSSRAKDANVIAALVDRFDPDRVYGKYGKGTKKNPGPFYGFSKDIWQAFAVGLYSLDTASVLGATVVDRGEM